MSDPLEGAEFPEFPEGNKDVPLPERFNPMPAGDGADPLAGVEFLTDEKILKLLHVRARRRRL